MLGRRGRDGKETNPTNTGRTGEIATQTILMSSLYRCGLFAPCFVFNMFFLGMLKPPFYGVATNAYTAIGHATDKKNCMHAQQLKHYRITNMCYLTLFHEELLLVK